MQQREYRPGEIVIISVQVQTGQSYGYWIVLEHSHVMHPDGTKERVKCLSPVGTIVEWSPRYICYPDAL